MASYVYLIQNGDLFNIGFTNNLERSRIELRPGELIAFSMTEKSETIIKNIIDISPQRFIVIYSTFILPLV